MNVPSIAATIAALGLVYHLMPHTASSLTRDQSNEANYNQLDLVGAAAQLRAPNLHQIWVDTPENTTLRDDTCCHADPTIQGVWQHVTQTYRSEAASDPGVALVAHAVL